jgi:electron transport complex protein RnfG
MVISLVLVCLVAAFALSRVYLVTKPVIEQQKIDATKRALTEVLPAAASFSERKPGQLWYGLDGDGNKVGIVFKVAPRGYAGPVETMAGVDLDGRVVGIRIASPAEGMRETPGLGLKARESWFTAQFGGKSAGDLRLKKDGGTIDAISAATITSRAVTNGLADGLRRYAEHLAPSEPAAGEATDGAPR